MGWAKYCEDNMSIYIGRIAGENSTSDFYVRYEGIPIKKKSSASPEKPALSGTVIRPREQSGRRGLELIFQNGVEDSMIRKLQMNGWWWSKSKACWCNLDTQGNRKYAEILLCLGAKLMTVA